MRRCVCQTLQLGDGVDFSLGFAVDHIAHQTQLGKAVHARDTDEAVITLCGVGILVSQPVRRMGHHLVSLHYGLEFGQRTDLRARHHRTGQGAVDLSEVAIDPLDHAGHPCVLVILQRGRSGCTVLRIGCDFGHGLGLRVEFRNLLILGMGVLSQSTDRRPR